MPKVTEGSLWQRQEQESKPPACQSSALTTRKPLPSLSFSPAHPSCAAVQSSIFRIEGKNTEILITVHLYFSKEMREERYYSVRILDSSYTQLLVKRLGYLLEKS